MLNRSALSDVGGPWASAPSKEQVAAPAPSPRIYRIYRSHSEGKHPDTRRVSQARCCPWATNQGTPHLTLVFSLLHPFHVLNFFLPSKFNSYIQPNLTWNRKKLHSEQATGTRIESNSAFKSPKFTHKFTYLHLYKNVREEHQLIG